MADDTAMSSFSSVQAEEALDPHRKPALGQREAYECVSALAVGDVTSCYQSFTQAASWEDRWFCLENAGNVASSADSTLDRSLIDSWVQGWPDHPVPLFFRAAIDTFSSRSAEGDLSHLAALEPNNPLTSGLQVVDRAQSGVGDIEQAMVALLGLEPLYEPHVHFLRSLGPNGVGDAASAISFAASVEEIVPVGSALRAMVPLAAIEIILAEQPADHLACLETYGLVDSIMMAAGQSVFHPSFDGPPSVPAIKAVTAFMVALVLLKQDDLALMLHRRLDGVFADWPFSLLASPSTSSWIELGQHMTRNAPVAAAASGRD